ncbi:hypothetical protein TNCV_4749021 [Trichonephila clavipes]|nr:hypothetical protein TNCV_4749021 [Trichonephila clavipes]
MLCGEYTITFSSRNCDRRLSGNYPHALVEIIKDTCATLNYCVVPSWITRRPLKSRGTTFPSLAGCNEMLKRGAGPLIPEQREEEPGRDALNLHVSGRQRDSSSLKPLI